LIKEFDLCYLRSSFY